MFFGDSHSRQFVGVSWGIFSHYVFSGATIAGLASTNSKTGHGLIVKEALAPDREKLVFLMFGSVDFDFSLVRELVRDPGAGVEAFVERRVTGYRDFLRSIVDDPALIRSIRKICVCAPQISPLRNDNFFVQTPKHTEDAEADVRALAQRIDLSDRARGAIVGRFNDRLEGAVADMAQVEVMRIDREMLDEQGLVLDRFVSPLPEDHHAVAWATMQLWQPLIRRYIEDFRHTL